jgi:DNA-binding NarL/FixJ family response regulator
MIRILIADDPAVVRRGLKQLLLEKYPTASIGKQEMLKILLRRSMNQEWDVVICDMNMPGRSGLDALQQIKELSPKLPVLIMSVYPEDQYALRVLKAGASGYLAKETIHDDLVKAIEMVRIGRKFITPGICRKISRALDTGSARPPHEELSNREFDVFKLLTSGRSVSEIALTLSLSSTTVSTYRSRIMAKMHMRSIAELTRYALEHKLV